MLPPGEAAQDMKFAAGLKGATFDGSSSGASDDMVPLSEHAFAWVLPQIVQSAMADR